MVGEDFENFWIVITRNSSIEGRVAPRHRNLDTKDFFGKSDHSRKTSQP